MKKIEFRYSKIRFSSCCPTWIRTKTNGTKNRRTTFILSDNPLSKLLSSSEIECKCKAFF